MTIKIVGNSYVLPYIKMADKIIARVIRGYFAFFNTL